MQAFQGSPTQKKTLSLQDKETISLFNLNDKAGHIILDNASNKVNSILARCLFDCHLMGKASANGWFKQGCWNNLEVSN